MFGGLSYNEEEENAFANNEVYVLQLRNNKANWTKIECKGEYPLPRTYHTACRVGS